MQNVAEVAYNTARFGFRSRQKLALVVLDGTASAAWRVQQEEADVLLWVDLEASAICLTENWEDGPVHHQLPAKIAVNRHTPDTCEVEEEVSIATITFVDRLGAELFGTLATSILPEWQSIRRSTSGKSLLVLADHWFVTEDQQALKLKHPDGHISVVLQLNVCHSSIVAEVVRDGQTRKRYMASCFGDVSKLLRKHSRPQQGLDKTVHTVLKELRPCTSSVEHLLAKLEGAANQLRRVPSMVQWCRGGIMAALVDCAAGLGGSSSGSQSQRQSTGGFDRLCQQQQHRSRSMPGAPPSQRDHSSSSEQLQTLQALSECCSLVLRLATDPEKQADLLVDCVCRAVTGRVEQAVPVLQLLPMLLRHVVANRAAVFEQLHQACCNSKLLRQLQSCYSATLSHVPMLSHPLEGLSPDDGATGPSMPSGQQTSVLALQAEQKPPVCQPGSCPDSPQQPNSPAGLPARHTGIPRLHLPATGECSARTARTAASSRSLTSADRGAPSGREVAATSFLKALQQLSYSCGQSVMAADLAAFVTHKQLLGGVLVSEATLLHNRAAGDSNQSGGGASSLTNEGKLSFGQLARLPPTAQLQIELLEVLVVLAEAPSCDLVLPRSWEWLLLSPFLGHAPSWLQADVAVISKAVAEQAYGQMRRSTMKLIQACSPVWHVCLPDSGSSSSSSSSSSSTQGLVLHQPVLEQFHQQLLAASEAAKSGACMHGVCAQLLLLLVDYLRILHRTKLADTACFMLGGALAQQEHMLRSTRVEHWPWEAVQHMDALVQLYAQLLQQVTCASSASWLLGVLGAQLRSSRMAPFLLPAGDSSSGSMSSPGPHTPVPADLLQLVLEYVQTYLAQLTAAAESLGSRPAAAQAAVQGESAGSSNSCSSGLSASVQAALWQDGAGAHVSEFKAHCWVLLTRLLQLASHQPAFRLPEPSMSRAPSSSSQQPPTEAGGSRTPGALASPNRSMASIARLMDGSGGCSTATPRAAVPPGEVCTPTSNKKPALPPLALGGSGSYSRTPSSSTLAPLTSSRQEGCGVVHGQAAHASGSGSGSLSGRCSIWQLLVEQLMVNSSMGQATVLQHIDATHNHKLHPCLQQAVVGFLSVALGMPDSYAFSKPQLAEFYVHHHFLYFTQHYHKLPSSGSVASALCKSHLQVLLALCHQTSGANQVRRRFLQLKVLEFLAREASLEYMCRHNQLALSPGSSNASTPLSTSRTGNSCRTSAGGGGTADPSVGRAGAGGSPGLATAALGLLAAGAAGWEGSSHSARGPTSSRLWASSPGCQASARSALSTQRSWSTKALCAGVEGPARRHDQHGGGSVTGSQGPMAAAQQPISFELETFRAAGADLLLTGSSGLLTGSSAVLTGSSGLHTNATGAFSAGSRGRGSSGGANIQQPQQQQQQQRVPKLGSSVQAAVQAFEAKASESAASFPMLPRPQPPKAAAPAADAGGRRQPGHMRLVCDEAAPAALCSGAAAVKHDDPVSLSAGQQDVLRTNSTEQQQQQAPFSVQRLAGGGSRQAALPPIPMLKLPTHNSTNACVGSEGSSCRKQPLTHSVRLAWQPLGSPQGDAALDAGLPATAGGLTSPCGSSSSRGSSGSSSDGGVSPRCDIEGWEVPASVRSQRRIKQPELTGDASWDNIIIDTWERETGLEFQFDGLSETDTATCSGSTSSGSTPRAAIPGSSSSSSPCQPTSPNQAVSERGLRGFPQSQTSGATAPSQLQEVPALTASWCMPQLGLGAVGRPCRWISSSDSVEEATAPAGLLQILGGQHPKLHCAALAAASSDEGNRLCAAALGGQHPELCCAALAGTSSDEGNQLCAEGADADHKASSSCDSASGSPVASAGGGAGGGADAQGPHPVPKLQISMLQGTAASNSASAASGGVMSPAQRQLQSSYRKGYDLEEDLEHDWEQYEVTGHWGDSDCGESCSEASASPDRQRQQQVLQLALPQQGQRQVPALHLPHQQPSIGQWQQQQVPSPGRQQGPLEGRLQVPALHLPHQQQQQQQDCQSPPHFAPSSADTQAHADVRTTKRKSPSKKQVVMGGAGMPVTAEVQAHALVDCGGGCSSSSEGEDDSCSSDIESADAVQALAFPNLSAAAPAQSTPVPRLNMTQVHQQTGHLAMLLAPPGSSDGNEAGFSSSSTRTTTAASRASYAASIAVLPLSTSRLSCGGGGDNSSRSCSHHLAAAGPVNMRLAAAAASAQRQPSGWSTGSLQAAAMLAAGATGGDPLCTPSAHMCGGDAAARPYAVHRAKCGLYMDPELHVLCLELALHLLVTPTGQLDNVQLPHEPSDVSLQRKVLLLLEHLSHRDNLSTVCHLAQRACDTLRQQQDQQHQGLLPLDGSSRCSSQEQQHQQDASCVRVHSAAPGLADRSLAPDVTLTSSSDAVFEKTQRQLRKACDTLRESSTFVRPVKSAGGSSMSGNSKVGSSATAAAGAAAGLAGSTLRLLKLLSLPVLDMSSLTVGGMINKGAFSEVFSGTLRQEGCETPVALKVMDCSEDDACSFERVYNEVASLDALRGQASVVQLKDYGVTSSVSGARQWVLVFPQYAGSMREWRLKWRGKGLNTQDLPVYLRLFIRVAQAVAVLHSCNIVHFDIKGDNVLLEEGFNPAESGPACSHSSTSAALSSRRDGSSRLSGSRVSSSTEDRSVVLADFGDALMLENADASSQRHRGTELFSSPEMLLLHAGRQHAQHAQHDRRKHRGVHAAHDVWSLGCTLYELLTGTVLFEEEGVGRITSYSSSQSSGGGANGLQSDGRGWGVLNAREKAALQHHGGCIELVESMLVGEPNWRPTAEQVIRKAEKLLGS